MSLHERALCLLSCSYVDDIILGAPAVMTKNLCTTMNIAVVCAGTRETNAKMGPGQDPYVVAKELCAMPSIHPRFAICSGVHLLCVRATSIVYLHCAIFLNAARLMLSLPLVRGVSARGIFTTVKSGNLVTTKAIRDRILENYVAFKTRNESKEKAEATYEDTKQYLGETAA